MSATREGQVQIPEAPFAAQHATMNMSQYMNNSFTNSTSAANQSQPAAYSPPKQPFNQSYQMQHPSNSIPATQSLPATQPVQPAVVPPVQSEDKPQSNGTTSTGKTACDAASGATKDVKDKENPRENHVTLPQNQKNSVSDKDKEKVDKDTKDKEKDKETSVLEPAEVPQVSAASSISSTSLSATSLSPEKSDKSEDKVDKVEKIKEYPPFMTEKTKERLEKLAKLDVDLKCGGVGTPKEKDKELVASKHVDTTSSTTDTKTPEVDAKTKNEKDSKDPESTTPIADKDKEKEREKLGETEKEKVDEVKQEAQSTTADVPVPTTPQKLKEQSTPTKSPIKVATTPRTPQRKSRTPKAEVESPRVQKAPEPRPSTSKSPSGKTKRSRVRTQHYQSPLPELEILSKITHNATAPPRSIESKLIVFYKNEFLAVRNSEGGFFVCQAVQNVYKSSSRIKIRWLSQDKNEKSGEIYTPDFYDFIDFECILTNLELSRVEKGRFRLPPKEKLRTDSILKRAIAVEKGEAISLDDSLTEDNPDGLDVSLYTEEDQLVKRKGTKRKLSKGRPPSSSQTPSKREKIEAKTTSAKQTPKKTARKITTPVSEPKTIGRAERAKRRSAPEPSPKSSPIIDEKKAKVLAKVVKRTAITITKCVVSPAKTPTKVKPAEKPTKQPVASTSKAKTVKSSPPPARKPGKRTRK